MICLPGRIDDFSERLCQPRQLCSLGSGESHFHSLLFWVFADFGLLVPHIKKRTPYSDAEKITLNNYTFFLGTFGLTATAKNSKCSEISEIFDAPLLAFLHRTGMMNPRGPFFSLVYPSSSVCAKPCSSHLVGTFIKRQAVSSEESPRKVVNRE